jgi:glycosyltransferase involved in cell wall biosynthesis
VVIAAYEAERWIGDAIRSVLDQVPAPHELIVVDDGSRDRTAEIASGFPGVLVLRQENRGAAVARNLGARSAAGEAILFLDADDALLPGALETLDASLRSLPGVNGFIPNYVKDGDASGFGWDPAAGDRLLDRGDVVALARGEPVSANALVMADAWRRSPFRELRRSEDLDFWLRMLLDGGRVVRMATPLVRVRVSLPAGAPNHLRAKRAGRRRVLGDVVRRPDLTAGERVVVLSRLARTSIGVLLAPRARASGIPSVAHVHLDDGGGGPAHVAVLIEALRPHVACSVVALHAADLRTNPARWFRMWLSLARAIQRTRPTIVHAHGVRAAAAALPVARAARVPLVVTVHGLHSLRRSDSAATRFCNRRVLSGARAVVVLGESDRQLILRDRLADPGRVHRVPAAFGPRALPSSAAARSALGVVGEEVVVTWIGRLSAEKAPQAFVDGIALVDDPHVRALLAGDGDLRVQVRRAVAASGIQDRVRILGWVDDPSQLLAATDILVSTSRWEGLPTSVIEAAAAGCSLVLTDVPGNRDLVDAGVPALLVPPGRADRLADAIGRLAADPERRSEMADEASRVVRERFTPEALAEGVLSIYRTLG